MLKTLQAKTNFPHLLVTFIWVTCLCALISAVVAWGSIYSQNDPNKDTTSYAFWANNSKTGKLIVGSWNDGDSLTTIYSFVNGKLEGKLLGYYDNKSIECIINFKNGIQTGESRYFYKNGAIKRIAINNNGINIYWIEFDPDGKIFQEGDLKTRKYENGKLWANDLKELISD